MNATLCRDLTTIAGLAAHEWISTLIDAQPEAAELTAELVADGIAHVELRTEFLGSGVGHRLLLVPRADLGDPVELFSLGGLAAEPSPEALATRRWFFGRLSHWNAKH